MDSTIVKMATIAIDVGASKITGALINSHFEILEEVTIAARESLYGDADPELALTKGLITSLLELAREKNIKIQSGGACFAEYVTPSGELNSKDQIAWSIQPKDDFRKLTGFSWVIESDVRAMALAETKFGASDFLYITISSGISHALVIAGKPWAGATGEAIGFGVIQIDKSKVTPTLEEFSSGLGIARRYQSLGGGVVMSAVDVFQRYESDQIAQEVINSAAEVLGKALAASVEMIDPAQIIIGGGLWLGSSKYQDLVLASYQVNTTKRRPAPSISSAQRGRNAAVIGAAIAAT